MNKYTITALVLSLAIFAGSLFVDNAMLQGVLIAGFKASFFFAALFITLRYADRIIGVDFVEGLKNREVYYAVRFVGVAIALAWLLS